MSDVGSNTPPREREEAAEQRAEATRHELDQHARSELSPGDRRRADEAAMLDAKTTYEVIREEGEKELERSNGALAFSGLAAGLSMGLSMVGQAMLHAHLPDAPWRPLVVRFGYSVGFLAVIAGSQQLFTENTLTPVVPYLSKKSGVTLAQVLRLWSIVFATNILGTFLFALAAAFTPTFSPEIRGAFAALGTEAVAGTFWATFARGIAAGWVIALMVWMLPGARHNRLWIIVIMTYVIGVAGMSHIIAGSSEVLYVVLTGAVPWSAYWLAFMLPTLLGNIIGGVTLVAALNHGQVTSGE
jgi:formate/nitrite transporter FocA (FNT family)